MKKSNRKWKKILVIIAVVIGVVTIGRYALIEYLKSELESKIKGCELESRNFNTVIDFEYVNNWIIVQVKVDGSDKEFPFLFDTGAPSIVLDKLLNEIGPDNYDKLSFTDNTKKDKTAFNNELITINGLELGDVRFSEIGTLSARNSEWGMLNCISAYGIIGFNIIGKCTYQIDYENKKIIITDKVENLSNYNDINWIGYKAASKQESPVISAKINDSLNIKLLFDTGMSGGVKLFSSHLYDSLSKQSPNNFAKFISKPSIRIRGEKDEPNNFIKYRATNFSFGNINCNNINITISDKHEREYTGLIGNQIFENYTITLDYKNKRIGLIRNKEKTENNTTFGLTYLPRGDKLFISSLFEDYPPIKEGVELGDEVYAINGIRTDDMDSTQACEVYRRELSYTHPTDSILDIEIIKDGGIVNYNFKKQYLFAN